jgi:hypothetical protein
MDYILCRTCEQGNPSYLRLCSNCNADLFAESEENPILPIVEEENLESLRKMVLTAIVISFFTTAFKIWFLYSLKSNSYRNFPTISDILLILSPIIIAAVTSAKTNKWYRVLLADSILMAILFVFGLFFFIYGLMK